MITFHNVFFAFYSRLVKIDSKITASLPTAEPSAKEINDLEVERPCNKAKTEGEANLSSSTTNLEMEANKTEQKSSISIRETVMSKLNEALLSEKDANITTFGEMLTWI